MFSPNLIERLTFDEDVDIRDKLLLNHTMAHGTSFLAAKALEEEYDQIVCQSGTNWFIGAEDEDTGKPVVRDSQYFGTEEEARNALKQRSWEQRLHP